MTDPTVDRRSLLGGLLAAPVVSAAPRPLALPELPAGHIWVQVSERAWAQFIEAARALESIAER